VAEPVTLLRPTTACGHLLTCANCRTRQREEILTRRSAEQALAALRGNIDPRLEEARPRPSEMRVIVLAAEGLEREEIAKRTDLTLNTVKSHLRRASLRLGAGNTAGLVAICFRNGWIR
jgi:DNA-binding NarL/FixJ family response regulator